MARIGLNIDVSGLSGQMIIRWVKATNLSAEVGRSAAFAFPYSAVYTIDNITREVYIVQLWRSDDGSSLDQLIKDWNIDASLVNIIKFTTYQYEVDRGHSNTFPVSTGTEVWADPADGDDTLTDERLDGFTQEDMLVHEAGYGNKLNSAYTLLSGGGIVLTGGAKFNNGTGWFITVSGVDTVSVDPGPVGASGQYEGVEILSADQDFDDGTTPLANKLVIANWAGSVGVIVFPDLALIADGTHVTFNTHGGSQKYLKLQFDVGDSVKFLNQNANVIYLAKCEKISLFFYDGVCYVTDYDGRALERGNIIYDYDSSRASESGAQVLADEATGELLEADYPGLYAQVDSMPAGKVNLGTGVGEWSYDSGGGVYPNKRFFGIKTTDPKKVRVPHLSGMVVKFGSTPGLYEKDDVYVDPATGLRGVKYTGNNTGTSFDSSPGEINNREGYTIQTTGGVTETRVKSVTQIPYIIL